MTIQKQKQLVDPKGLDKEEPYCSGDNLAPTSCGISILAGLKETHHTHEGMTDWHGSEHSSCWMPAVFLSQRYSTGAAPYEQE